MHEHYECVHTLSIVITADIVISGIVIARFYCSFDDWVLVYYLPSLPLKPWPRKGAGVPCFLTTNPNNQGPMIPIERPSRSQIMVSSDLNFRDNEDAKDELYNNIGDQSWLLFWNATTRVFSMQYQDLLLAALLPF